MSDARNPDRDRVGDAAPITVYVGDVMKNKPIEISADLLTSVKQIKDQLEPKTGVAFSECALFWKGRLMEDEMILEDYEIPAGTVVDMLWTKAFKCADVHRIATGAYAEDLKRHYEETWAELVPARNFDAEDSEEEEIVGGNDASAEGNNGGDGSEKSPRSRRGSRRRSKSGSASQSPSRRASRRASRGRADGR
jgi:hypothetical protein